MCECSSVRFEGAILIRANLEHSSLGEAFFFNPQGRPRKSTSIEYRHFELALQNLEFLKYEDAESYRLFADGKQGNRMLGTDFKHATNLRMTIWEYSDISLVVNLIPDQISGKQLSKTVIYPDAIERLRDEIPRMDRNMHA